jgi:hypothetical protein
MYRTYWRCYGNVLKKASGRPENLGLGGARAIFLVVGDDQEGGKKRKKKEKGIETIQLIMQCPSSENDFGILVLDDGLFMLHCRHLERRTPSPAAAVLGPCGVGAGRRRHQRYSESELGFDQFSGATRGTKVVIVAASNKGMDAASIRHEK